MAMWCVLEFLGLMPAVIAMARAFYVYFHGVYYFKTAYIGMAAVHVELEMILAFFWKVIFGGLALSILATIMIFWLNRKWRA